MTRLLLGLALSSIVLATSCEPPVDDNPSVLRNLRALAIRATPAEPAAGGLVTLSALAYDPHGRAIEYEWSVCLPLLLAENDPDAPAVTVADCVPPENRLVLGTGSPLEVSLSAVPETGNAPIILRTHAGGDVHYSLKRVIIGSAPVDSNPQLTSVWLNGQDPGEDPMPALAGDIIPVSSNSVDPSATTTTYYVSGGAIDCPFVTPDCNVDYFGGLDWVLPNRSGTYEVFAVARNGTGTDWETRSIEIP
jgi:hypothetical protein